MKKTFSSKKSAFSLIELSIVLIIIGLLIAGITGGASLIKSSELRSAMGEARGYAVAVNGFYSQYNYLPGDYATAVAGGIPSSTSTAAYTPTSGTAAASGQNGKIEFYTASVTNTGCQATTTTTTATACASESVAAWNQLVKTGTIDSAMSITYIPTTVAQVAGTNMPASKIKFAGWHFDYRTAVGTPSNSVGDYTGILAEGVAAAPAYQNVVVLTGTTTTGAALSSTAASLSTLVNGPTNLASAALTGPDAMSIDTKIDDSYANAGKVRGLNPGATTACYSASASANASYTVTSSTSKVCALTFQVDVNT